MSQEPTPAAPPLLTHRTGQGDMLISTSRQWPAKRQDILRRLDPLLVAAARVIPPLDPEVLLQEDRGEYLEQQVQWGVETGESRGGTLLLPKPLAHRQPAVLCCPYDGPTSTVTLCRELVKRGFVVLAPHQPRTRVDKTLWDYQRGLDLLCHLDAVDSDRLAAIGQGRGGLDALILAAYDHRIKAVAAACAYEPRGAGKMEIWEGSLGPETPVFAWVEVLALIAPRAFHYTYARQDEVLPLSGLVSEDMIELGRLYDLLGCRDKFSTTETPEGHGYPLAARREAYAVFKRVLKERG